MIARVKLQRIGDRRAREMEVVACGNGGWGDIVTDDCAARVGVAARRAFDSVEVAVHLEGGRVHLDAGATRGRCYLIDVDGEGVQTHGCCASVDLRACDDGEDDAYVVVVDEVGVSVGGDEGVLCCLRQVGDVFDAVVGRVDVVGDVGDGVDEEVVGVGEADGDRTISDCGVKGEGDTADAVRECKHRAGGFASEGVVGWLAIVRGCAGGDIYGVDDGQSVVVHRERRRGAVEGEPFGGRGRQVVRRVECVHRGACGERARAERGLVAGLHDVDSIDGVDGVAVCGELVVTGDDITLGDLTALDRVGDV